jgi:hypothetical protein
MAIAVLGGYAAIAPAAAAMRVARIYWSTAPLLRRRRDPNPAVEVPNRTLQASASWPGIELGSPSTSPPAGSPTSMGCR